MRDDDSVLLPSGQSLPPVVVQQPDPMLEEQPVGWFRVALTAVGAAVVVALVLYGLNRPPERQQTATSEPSQTALATTGQGSSSGQAAQSGTAEAPSKGQVDQSKTPPASGSSAGSDTGPAAKPAPAAK